MTKEIADLTLQFLQRVQLSAVEISSFMAVKRALESVQDVVTEERVENDLKEYGDVEQRPKLEGRQLVMVLAPSKKKK